MMAPGLLQLGDILLRKAASTVLKSSESRASDWAPIGLAQDRQFAHPLSPSPVQEPGCSSHRSFQFPPTAVTGFLPGRIRPCRPGAWRTSDTGACPSGPFARPGRDKPSHMAAAAHQRPGRRAEAPTTAFPGTGSADRSEGFLADGRAFVKVLRRGAAPDPPRRGRRPCAPGFRRGCG